MTWRKGGIFIPVGSFAVAAGTLLRFFTHAKYTDFVVGLLTGVYSRGMAAYKRGNSITLQEYVDGMDRRPRQSRKKVS